MRRILAVTVLLVAVVLGHERVAMASHITGFDLSHTIDPSGLATFRYRAYHANNLKYPASSRPATDAFRFLHFGDGQSLGVWAEEVTGGPPNCDLDTDGRCRIEYTNCEPPGNDAIRCDTAITNRIYTHTYSCSDPSDLFDAFITRSKTATDFECCRENGFINIPDSGSTDIRPQTRVAPCCRNSRFEPNSGPVFSSPPVFNAFQEVRYLHPLGATDPDADPLTFLFRSEAPASFFSCPGGCPTPPLPAMIELSAFDQCQDPLGARMTIGAANQLDWNLPRAGSGCDVTRLGFYGVGVQVEDRCMATASREFRLELFDEPTTNPPVLTLTTRTPPGLTDICIDMDTVVIDLRATDLDLSDIVTLTMNPTGVPNVTFTPVAGNPATGRFTFAPKKADFQLGTHGFTFIAQDDELPVHTDQKSVTISVIECNHPPIADAGGPYVKECEGTPTLTQLDGSRSSDPDGDPLEFSWLSNCPGAFFDDKTSPTPIMGRNGAPPCPFSCTITLSVRDPFGGADADSTTLTLNDTIPPTAVGLDPDVTIGCTDPIPPVPPVTGADDCDPAVTTTFRETAVAGNCQDRYSLHREWTLADICGNRTVANQVVSVDDPDAPVLSGVPANQAAECDAVPAPATVTAADVCDPDVKVEFSEARTPRTCPQSYILKRTWTATDRCGNRVSQTQAITVSDTVAPVLVGVPADATADCTAVPTPPVVTATDTCDRTPSVTLVESTTPGTCSGNYTIVRTWTATDECGNASEATQVVTVQDRRAPILIGVPADTTVECDAVPLPPVVSATDDCDSDPDVVLVESIQGGSCANAYVILRTWTATDECGNSSSQEQRITVRDTVAPVLSAIPADVTVECDAVPAVAMVTASDNCDPAVTVSFVEQRIDGACAHSYTLVRKWEAIDDCGNATSREQRINVRDTTAPVLAKVPVDATVECDAVPGPPTVTVTDNCDSAVTVNFSEQRIDGACAHSYTLVRTWEAIDDCGNATSREQRISVRDTTAPVLAKVPVDATVECDAVPGPPTVTVTDNCDSAVTVNFSEQRIDGTCAHSYTLVRTWEATDDCGNATSREQRISVRDTTGPVLAMVPIDATAECDAVPVAPTVTATDNCDPTVTVSYSELRIDGACDDSYTLRRTWTASDDCGNVRTATQLLTVADSTAPVFTGLPPDITAECDSIPPAPVVSVRDNCDPAPSVTLRETRIDGTCADAYTIVREWTARDRCGNERQATRLLQVVDTTKPVVTAMLEPLPPRSSSSVSSPRPPRSPRSPASACSAPASGAFRVQCSASDNCDPAPTLSARLLVTIHDVIAGVCVARTEVIAVTCGEELDIHLVPPPCPAKPPKRPRSALSVISGRKVVSGEAVILEVEAVDRCGNVGTATWDPTTAKLPCPDLGYPGDPKCDVPVCGRRPTPLRRNADGPRLRRSPGKVGALP